MARNFDARYKIVARDLTRLEIPALFSTPKSKLDIHLDSRTVGTIFLDLRVISKEQTLNVQSCM
jgi:hypothetical protein